MEAFGSILGPLGAILKPAMGVMGMINQMSLASKQKAAMDRAIYYSKHPEAISAIAGKLEKPLSTGLTTGVGNVVNASMAEQGLSQAPGIQSQVLAQALAPYQQRNQETALQAALQAIGLPMEAMSLINNTQQSTDLASILKGLLPGGGGSSGVPYPYSSIPKSPDPTSGITVDWGSIPDPVTGIPAGGGGSIYGG